MPTGPIRAAMVARAGAHIEGVATMGEVADAVQAAGLVVREYPFRSELTALILGRHVYVRDDLDPESRKLALAHELGHFVLGHGNMLLSSPLTRAQLSVYGNRDERDAQIFGGVFVLGYPFSGNLDDRLREAVDDGMPVSRLFAFFNALAVAVGDARQALA